MYDVIFEVEYEILVPLLTNYKIIALYGNEFYSHLVGEVLKSDCFERLHTVFFFLMKFQMKFMLSHKST